MQRRAALANCNITHVVSALRGPLDRDLYAKYEHLVVELDDLEDEDIVQHFATTNSFIRGGLAGDGGVLVHWCVARFPFMLTSIFPPAQPCAFAVILTGHLHKLSEVAMIARCHRHFRVVCRGLSCGPRGNARSGSTAPERVRYDASAG